MKFHKDFDATDISIGYSVMVSEIVKANLPRQHPLRELFKKAWASFENNEWAYESGFENELIKHGKFEIASFLREWRFSQGYYGKETDREFYCIMILLNYKPEVIFFRRSCLHSWIMQVLYFCVQRYFKKEGPEDRITL